jgi:hypothetical protein
MNTNLKSAIRNLSNIPGWKTNRKLLVLESDDWGSVRMPSLEVLEILKKKGLELETIDSFRYNNYDTLAGTKDFELLFELLEKHKDAKGNSAVFTAVSVVANPDFEKIKANDYKEYYFETFDKTLERYGYPEAFNSWMEGIERKLFIPQFHAREHLNVPFWMRALQSNDEQARIAFDYGIWGFNNIHKHGCFFQSAFDLEYYDDVKVQAETIKSGLKVFESLFGYKAEFFVPPNGPFNNILEEAAFDGGIKYISASKIQHEPLGEGKTRKRFHYIGQRNRFKQIYLTRNCIFEPASPQRTDWVDSCLSDIEIAFKWKKPAVISTHRVNYIGQLNPKNREKGLKELDLLLQKITLKWPDVEFITSQELGAMLLNGG